ncbi:MAG: virulence protein RhuM/Fic/DOC family protein [Desulfuromonadaceae bacterium]|nr:virulence protein RhuM/Fic/DOC family protein [Desulfuromonadaceae bacterium]
MTRQIIIYEGQDGATQLEVHLEAETVWLTIDQMADLFARDKSGISRHLSNIFKEKELDKDSVVAKCATTAADGKTYQVDYYNLDAIISVGYKVNSKQGTKFRQWATKVLRDHLVQGYTINKTRIAEKGLSEMQQAVDLLARTLSNQALVTEAGQDVLAVIVGYAKTWRLLLQYDEDALALPPGCQPARGVLDYKYAAQAIADLKCELQTHGEATGLFGTERGDALDAILGNIEQTMFGESLYRTREEKAAHLLYFIIKDHPFLDGNKRIGSFLFVLYQRQEGMNANINENMLTALALLIAESQPENKNLMVRLVVNLLVVGE